MNKYITFADLEKVVYYLSYIMDILTVAAGLYISSCAVVLLYLLCGLLCGHLTEAKQCLEEEKCLYWIYSFVNCFRVENKSY
jgi:hypothetical protein